MTTNAFVHGIHANFNSPVHYTQIDDISFMQNNGLIGIQPWVIQLPKYAGMSKSDNSKAISSDLQFRPLCETVKATHEWWYSDAVDPNRREQLLGGPQSLYNREKDILTKWKSN